MPMHRPDIPAPMIATVGVGALTAPLAYATTRHVTWSPRQQTSRPPPTNASSPPILDHATNPPRAPRRSAFTPGAPAQQAEVRDDERGDEVQSTLDEGGRARITRDDHVELVDRRQNDADNQSYSQRAAQVGTLAAVADRGRKALAASRRSSMLTPAHPAVAAIVTVSSPLCSSSEKPVTPSIWVKARLTLAWPTRSPCSSARPSQLGRLGWITSSVFKGAFALTPSIACSSMNGAAAAHACGMQATG